jgi:hypothetical protein
MKAAVSVLVVVLFFVYFCAQGGPDSNDPAAQRPNIDSQQFRSAVNYGIAQTLYFTFEANCWSPLCGAEAFQLTKQIHEKLGQPVKMDIFERKANDGSVEIYVFFPDFRLPTGELYLRFSKTDGRYLFLEQGFEDEFLRYDFAEKGLEMVLPKDYAGVVKTEFDLRTSDVARLGRWCQEMLREDYPSDARKTNHFFVAPFSSRYDSYQASVYWVEGKKIIRIEQVTNPTGQSLTWNETENYDQPVEAETISDYASSYEWRNFVISRHVIDGLMLTVDGLAATNSAN